MSKGHIDRRRVLTGAAATAALGFWSALGATSGQTLKAQQPGVPADEGFVFVVTIPGLCEASKNIREIAIDELNLDSRLYGPGAAHWGSATITTRVAKGGSKELQAWWQEAAKGRNIRKNISVLLFKSDKSAGRSYSLYDCFPTAYSTVNFDTSSTVQTETLTVKVGRIEFA